MFPIIEVTGTARERGRIHGSTARARIDRSIATYARLFAYCGIDWQGAQQLGAGYRDLIGDLDPALLDEIEGIAAGSGRHVNEILALNARTEILPPSYPAIRIRSARRSTPAMRRGVPDWGECTSIAIKPAQSTTGTTLLAQNWDWLGAQRAALVLLRCAEADGSSLPHADRGGHARQDRPQQPRLRRVPQHPALLGRRREARRAGARAAARAARARQRGRRGGVRVEAFLRRLVERAVRRCRRATPRRWSSRRAAWRSSAARTRRCATPTISSPRTRRSTRPRLRRACRRSPGSSASMRSPALTREVFAGGPATHAARRIRRLPVDLPAAGSGGRRGLRRDRGFRRHEPRGPGDGGGAGRAVAVAYESVGLAAEPVAA